MSDERPEYAYIGRADCGCVLASVVDFAEPKRLRKTTAQGVAEMINSGLHVERVKLVDVQLNWDCPHNEAKAAEQAVLL